MAFIYALPAARILIPDVLFLVAFAALAKLCYRITPIYILFILPGTLAHELAHWGTAVLTNGKPQLPIIVPRRTREGWLLGHVVFKNPRWYNTALITLAPLLLLPAALWIYLAAIAHLPLHSAWHWVALYVAVAAAFSALPSTADVRLAWRYSAPVLITAAVIASASCLYAFKFWYRSI